MIASMPSERRLPRPEMAQFTEEVRGAARRLSRDQILDLADMLHDLIRERRSADARPCV